MIRDAFCLVGRSSSMFFESVGGSEVGISFFSWMPLL